MARYDDKEAVAALVRADPATAKVCTYYLYVVGDLEVAISMLSILFCADQ